MRSRRSVGRRYRIRDPRPQWTKTRVSPGHSASAARVREALIREYRGARNLTFLHTYLTTISKRHVCIKKRLGREVGRFGDAVSIARVALPPFSQ